MWGGNSPQRTPRVRNRPGSRGSISRPGERPGSAPEPPPSAAQPQPDGRASWLRRKTRQRSGWEINSAGKTSPADADDACAAARVSLHVHACAATERLRANPRLASEGQAGYWKCVLIL